MEHHANLLSLRANYAQGLSQGDVAQAGTGSCGGPLLQSGSASKARGPGGRGLPGHGTVRDWCVTGLSRCLVQGHKSTSAPGLYAALPKFQVAGG